MTVSYPAKMGTFRQLLQNTSDLSRFVPKLHERLPATSLESHHHVLKLIRPILMAPSTYMSVQGQLYPAKELSLLACERDHIHCPLPFRKLILLIFAERRPDLRSNGLTPQYRANGGQTLGRMD